MRGFFGNSIAASLLTIAMFGSPYSLDAAVQPVPKSTASPTATAAKIFQGTTLMDGLLPVHVDQHDGRIVVTLPAAQADGVSARFLYAAALRTGLGSAPTFLDRGRIGTTQVVALRRYGKKIAAVFERPRFRAAGAGESASRTS